MNNKFYNFLPWVLLVVLIIGVMYFAAYNRSKLVIPVGSVVTTTEYKNTDYGFAFTMPLSWQGYSITEDEWKGYIMKEAKGAVDIETGPLISIRHPDWNPKTPRQDIPIMIFTLKQWGDLNQDKFHIGSAPINPGELGRNAKYVFAVPARYNYAFITGYEEVEQILRGDTLKTF